MKKKTLTFMLFEITIVPNVQVISYSTCSVCEEENEKVTEMGLEASNGAFEVVHTFPEWPHRGLESSPVGEHCVRVDPKRDRTSKFLCELCRVIELIPLIFNRRVFRGLF